MDKTSKICSKCKLDKPLSEFRKDASNGDGVTYRCKECYSVAEKEKRAKQRKEKEMAKQNNVVPGHKTCTKCEILKPFNEFGKRPKAKDGFKSACKDCEKEWKAQKYAENPDYYKDQYYANQDVNVARARNWRAVNPDKVAARSKEWYATHREYSAEQGKEWRKNHPAETRQYGIEYNRRKRDAIIQSFSSEDLDHRMAVFGYSCAYCSGPFEEIDHLIPLSKGGKHCLANLRPACRRCNRSKSDKDARVWLDSLKENR